MVQLLRARDCPERHDYLFRYLHTDLGPADAARVDTLLPGVERLRELSDQCFAWQDELFRPAISRMRPMADLTGETATYAAVRGLGLAHMDAVLNGNEAAARFLAGDVAAALAAHGMRVALG